MDIIKNQTGSRQEQLLTLLLTTKSGLSIDEMAEKLGISRNAVNQHLAVLEKKQLIKAAHLNTTKGRPARSYVLTDIGVNHFTKQYAWFCNVVLAELKEEMGSEDFSAFMRRLGRKIAMSLKTQFKHQNAQQKAETLTMILQNLGYQANVEQEGNEVTITAINCVFHDLAQEHHELCEFDFELIGALLDNPVEQTECMAQKGCACCFKTRV